MCEFESHWSHHGDTTQCRPTEKNRVCRRGQGLLTDSRQVKCNKILKVQEYGSSLETVLLQFLMGLPRKCFQNPGCQKYGRPPFYRGVG